MKKQHTKGPWYVVAVEIGDGGADFTAISTQPVLPKGRDNDFEHEVLGTSEWLRAKPEDLKLMAAAPELLELLKLVEGKFGHGDYNSDTEELWDRVRLMISKLEGT